MVKLICLGPQGNPRTGQSQATEKWVASSRHDILAINNNFEGMGRISKLIRTFVLPFRVIRGTWGIKPAAMYLSIKRSLFGAMADLACVLAYQLVADGPIVVHLHGADLASVRQSRLSHFLFRRIWKKVTDVIVLSPKMAEQLEGLPQRPIHIVRNFSEAFATAESINEKVAEFNGEPLRVLYLSNIMFTKGFTYLVDAIKSLRNEGFMITLTLAGKPLEDSCMTADEALARLTEGLGEGVEYLGAVHGARKWKLLDEAHVVALPTFYSSEAQPICLIEGMAFGCIPLTTRHNYNEDYLDPRSAIFVEKQSSISISEALLELMSNPKIAASRMQFSSEIAICQFDENKFVRAIDSVMNDAVQRTGGFRG